MNRSLTLQGWNAPRVISLAFGLTMGVVAALTVEHFFEVRFPDSLAAAAACEADSFFRCGDSANASIAAVYGVPIGIFGVMVGGLLALGALFPSAPLEKTNRGIAYLNALLGGALIIYSVVGLRSLCLLCTSYGVLAILSAVLFRLQGIGSDTTSFRQRYLEVSATHLGAFAALTVLVAWSATLYHDARKGAEAGTATAQIVGQFLALEQGPDPSVVSPFWVLRATERFEDAPLRVVEFSDFLCSDCRYLSEQLHRLEMDFAGRVNWAFQFFPLDAECNDVVEKDKFAGACELAYLAAHRPERFRQIHDELFANAREARSPEWRRELARRYDAEGAFTDSATVATVHAIIQTGKEFERTSERYEFGIRSTPTLIVNGRMLIGTLPYEQLRAILQAALDEETGRGRTFMENWVPGG